MQLHACGRHGDYLWPFWVSIYEHKEHPWNWPAKSMCSLCYGFSGQIHGYNGAVVGTLLTDILDPLQSAQSPHLTMATTHSSWQLTWSEQLFDAHSATVASLLQLQWYNRVFPISESHSMMSSCLFIHMAWGSLGTFAASLTMCSATPLEVSCIYKLPAQLMHL